MKHLILIFAILISSFAYGQEQIIKHKEATTDQRDAFSDPSGQHWYFYNSTDSCIQYWDGDSWVAIFGEDMEKIFNSGGLFKIQPYADGDVELFGDTDVLNSENSKIFKVWRKAAEGNDYIRFYISDNRVAYIHASQKLTLQSQNPFTINSVTDDIVFKVGDNAGSRKVYVRDSDGNTQAHVDSDGELFIRESLWMEGNGNVGDKISLYEDRIDDNDMYGFGVESNTLYHKSPEIHRWYIGTNTDSGTSDVMELTSAGLDINSNLIADKIYLTDSGSDYIGWAAGDGWFSFSTGIEAPSITTPGDLNGDHITTATADITDLLETPIIRNTDGNTVIIQDNVDIVGNVTLSGTVDGIDIADMSANRIQGAGILRKIQITVRDGATPGTNIDITKTTTQGRAYNAPSITDADNLAKSGSSGSYSLSSNGQNIVLVLSENVTHVLSCGIISDDLNNGVGGGYYVHTLVLDGDIQIHLEKSGEDDNCDWTSETGWGSNAVVFDICFLTSN